MTSLESGRGDTGDMSTDTSLHLLFYFPYIMKIQVVRTKSDTGALPLICPLITYPTGSLPRVLYLCPPCFSFLRPSPSLSRVHHCGSGDVRTLFETSTYCNASKRFLPVPEIPRNDHPHRNPLLRGSTTRLGVSPTVNS